MVADVKDCGSVATAIVANNGVAHPAIVDVRDENSVIALMTETEKTFGRLDILVNNAAVGSNTPPIAIEDIPVALWDDIMAVNIRGTFLCTRAAIPLMRRNGYGKNINLGSATMRNGFSHRLHYVASKGAIAAMTRSLAKELGPYGIRVNTLVPGLVMNESVAAGLAGKPGMREAVREARSIKEDLFAEQLLGTLIYLASPDSDAVTGQYHIVDNGQVFTCVLSRLFWWCRRPPGSRSIIRRWLRPRRFDRGIESRR